MAGVVRVKATPSRRGITCISNLKQLSSTLRSMPPERAKGDEAPDGKRQQVVENVRCSGACLQPGTSCHKLSQPKKNSTALQ